MKLSEHFTEKELACPCCGLYIPDVSLLIALEHVRFTLGPVTVNSSTRCEKHNKEIGGAERSMHLIGAAADITVKNTSAGVVHSGLDNSGFSNLIGLGKYNTFTHIDVRGYKARWG